MTWDTMEPREFYTLEEVADILRLTKWQVHRALIKRRRIRFHQAGKGKPIRIRHRDLEAYIESMAVDVRPETERESA